MKYTSTRSEKVNCSAAHAIIRGLAPDGGLYVPQEIPALFTDELYALTKLNYIERAIEILSLYLGDFTDRQLSNCVKDAYGDGFDSENITEMSHLYDGRYILELWHGPTCAFKDMALQILPRFMQTAKKITRSGKRTLILTATSGDTGTAALNGFKDIDGVDIAVFYPVDGVSPTQRLQMTTQEGKNVHVCAIKGNFDDAQAAVKTIFSDKALAAELRGRGIKLSSANSINWGRLMPQIVYYISAYVDLVKNGEIAMGDVVNVCVPTGNFGNIMAAYYAKMMGVPLGRLICASNRNNVLTDFINTGVYDKKREFYETIAPSMDILVSSNLERLLFELTDRDADAIVKYYKLLAKNGGFEVSKAVAERLKTDFYAGYCTDEEIKETIKTTFEKYSYLLDTHTAVAVKVYDDYRRETKDGKKVIIASTANPYKFVGSVYSALTGKEGDDSRLFDELERISEMPAPPQLTELKDKKVRFTEVIGKDDIADKVREIAKQF